MQEKLLQYLDAASAELLGEGVEAWIYALDDQRVVRIYKRSTSGLIERLKLLKDFYDSLDTTRVSFAVPRIFSIAEYQGSVYTIDQRLLGRPLGRLLRDVSDDQARPLLERLVETAEQVAAIHPAYGYYGEVLAQAPMRADSWPEYILLKLTAAYESAKGQFDQEIDSMKAIMNFIESEVEIINDVAHPQLVHGDFYGMNVLVESEKWAVTDFNELTLAGDPRMDMANAIFGCYDAKQVRLRPNDGQVLLEQLVRRHGKGMKRIVHLYRLYYAIIFASSCRESDPATYKWSIEGLKAHLAGSYDY